RFFWFASYQGQRQRRAETTATVTVFTPAELKGDFSLSNAARNRPQEDVVTFLQQYPFFQANTDLAARAVIDPSRIDPVAQKYIAANLIPASPAGQLRSQGSGKNDVDELTLSSTSTLRPRTGSPPLLGSSLRP